jgi:very-short-patch-repair endonuclease
VRPDIYSIKDHFLLKETIEKFGFPKENHSKVVSKCFICGIHKYSKILVLKSCLKRSGQSLCRKCSIKPWTDEKRIENKEKWEDPEYRKKQSEIRKKMWEDPEYRKKQSESMSKIRGNSELHKKFSDKSKSAWEDPEYRKRQSEIRKKIWEDPEYRKKQEQFKTVEWKNKQSEKQIIVGKNEEYKLNNSEKQKEVWKNEEYRNNQIEKQKEVWKNEEYRNNQIEKQKEVWKNEDYKSHFKKLWENPEFKQRLSNILKSKWKNDPEFRQKASLNSKRNWENQGYRNKVILGLRKLWENPEYKTKRSEASKKLWENPELREKCAISRSKQSGRKSSIEILTEFILTELKINNEPQSVVGPYIFDFLLPDKNIYIECQGEYWHSLPGRKERDAAKFSYLEKSVPESKILYLYEREFLNPVFVFSKISNFVNGHNVVLEQNQFDFESLKILEVSNDISIKFLNSFHYAAFGRSPKKVYGVYLGEELVAICKFSTVVRNEVATSMDLVSNQVLELDRFCIHPKYQKKNFASWFLSRVTKLIFKNFNNIQRLVSFSDLTYGHSGTIYKASNWTEIGRVRPDYYYVGHDGFILHKKTLYNRAVKMGMKEKEYAEKYEYEKSFGKEKLKFILNRSEV